MREKLRILGDGGKNKTGIIIMLFLVLYKVLTVVRMKQVTFVRIEQAFVTATENQKRHYYIFI